MFKTVLVIGLEAGWAEREVEKAERLMWRARLLAAKESMIREAMETLKIVGAREKNLEEELEAVRRERRRILEELKTSWWALILAVRRLKREVEQLRRELEEEVERGRLEKAVKLAVKLHGKELALERGLEVLRWIGARL